jgi:hypothetical protein
MGGPLDQEPHRISRLGGSEVKGVTFDCKGHEVPRAKVRRGHEAELHSGPGNLTNRHMSPIGRSQHPLTSHISGTREIRE